MIYLLVLLGLLSGWVLWKINKNLQWWKYFIPTVGTFLIIFITSTAVSYWQTTDTEYWTGFAQKAEYYEDWTEIVTRIETYSDGKNTYTRTVRDVVYHPEEFYVIDSNGITVSISHSEFNHFVNRFGNKNYSSVFRIGEIIKPGGKFVTDWDGSIPKSEIVTTSHFYENRLLSSKSVFKPKQLSKSEIENLYQRPKYINNYYMPCVIGWDKGERELSILNAQYGKQYQIKSNILVFQNATKDIAINQESLWFRGKKNELNICVGLSENKINWAYVFSWTERETFKIYIQDTIMEDFGKEFDIQKLISYLQKEIPQNWQRKQFADFKYIAIETPTWSIILILILVIGTNIIIPIILIKSHYEPFKSSTRWNSIRQRPNFRSKRMGK